MIFGFNTEVSCAGTNYHVQSELRSRESLMQTQVFVSGRCIGKISAPIPPATAESDAQDLLREQHRRAVAAARENDIQDLLEEQGSDLRLAWAGQGPTFARGRVRMHFVLSHSGEAAPGAEIKVHIENGKDAAQALSTSNRLGHARLSAEIGDADLAECLLTVEAKHEGRSIVRRYQLQRGPAPPPTK